ncbi:MAG TPA: ATP-binding protein [Bacteriovoracaceae bacterium]|nr:ATP-binding protein [Bacteriovoracaceae bacterium]
MDIVLKMPYKLAYPWFYFYKVIKISLLGILPALLVSFILLRKGLAEHLKDPSILDNIYLFQVFPLIIFFYGLFIYLFYRSTRPLAKLLGKIEKFQRQLPFEKQLDQIFRQDEWAQIEEAFNKADKTLSSQLQQIKNENDKNIAILESISDGILAVDQFESILFFNSNFANSFKFKQNQITPRLWHVFDDPNILSKAKSVLETGEATKLKEVKINNRFYDFTFTPLQKDKQLRPGLLIVIHDITEFKLTEQMRVDFVANVSHEIRTPITSIMGYSQLLKENEEKFEEDYRLFIDKILTNTERMMNLFNELLDLSVIESRPELTYKNIDLNQMLERVAENIKANYPQKDIQFFFNVGVHQVYVHERLFEQVLANLFDNACKYTESAVTIRVDAIIVGDQVSITVEDDGPGIPPHHLNRIFERFYRVEHSRETKRGTGLGLAIVKHIINKHNGKIRAESPGKGTKFTITLPLH